MSICRTASPMGLSTPEPGEKQTGSDTDALQRPLRSPEPDPFLSGFWSDFTTWREDGTLTSIRSDLLVCRDPDAHPIMHCERGHKGSGQTECVCLHVPLCVFVYQPCECCVLTKVLMRASVVWEYSDSAYRSDSSSGLFSTKVFFSPLPPAWKYCWQTGSKEASLNWNHPSFTDTSFNHDAFFPALLCF